MGTVYCLVLLCPRLTEVSPGTNGCFVCDSCLLLLYIVYFFSLLSSIFYKCVLLHVCELLWEYPINE